MPKLYLEKKANISRKPKKLKKVYSCFQINNYTDRLI